MKKSLLSFLALVALLVSFSFGQGAPAALTTGVPDVSYFLTTNIDGVGDTMKTDTATKVLFTSQRFQSGYDYILSRGAVVASGDSVAIGLTLTCVDNGQVTYPDTLLLEPAEQIVLPINKTILGEKFTLTMKGITAKNGATVVLPKFYVLKRRLQGSEYETPAKFVR